jgi:glutamyl-tRNA synthetase
MLHLGNLRTAVLAWLFAHADGGELLYRIEDLDASRVRPGYAEQQRADLEALGLTFDPPSVVQSQRFAAYESALDELADRTFECFCTRREIAEAASAPHATPGRYPGTCRELSETERELRRRERRPALRLRADPEPVTISDLLHGPVSGVPDDIVLRRNDGVAAYNLAVVVDDGDSGIDQVVRGDDLLESAISQAHLARLLGHQPPTYAHVGLALNSDGRRLAKRDGAVTLADQAQLGVGPDRVLDLIAKSLGLRDPGERIDLELLLDRFEPAALPRTPWVVTADASVDQSESSTGRSGSPPSISN